MQGTLISERVSTLASTQGTLARKHTRHVGMLALEHVSTLKIGGLHINNSLSEKLLGIFFDCKLKFNKRIEDICQKASRKFNAFARLAPYMETTKKRILMIELFMSQFNYCPLVWMYCNRS